jgi:hypothetical protein
MTRSHNSGDREYDFALPAFSQWKRLAIVWSIIVGAGLIVLLLTWNAFFKYVPPGKHLVIIAKNGEPLEEGQILAREGQKGIQEKVLGEGWHFVLPIVYATELEDNTIIPAGKAGIVRAHGGKPLRDGRILAEKGEQGIQREVLAPGAYRLNLKGFDVQIVDAVEIKPGYVGVVRRKLGKDSKKDFVDENSEEKGILKKVLQPGLYYLNTQEFEVNKAEVGISQTSFHKDPDPNKDTAMKFTSNGGLPIEIDCTVEWEVLPEHMPALLSRFEHVHDVEKKVIKVLAQPICRDKAFGYGVQDFLEGRTREKFQEDFTKELTTACAQENVTVHSAFIRRIEIPETYLKPIRDKKIAEETQETNKAKQLTAQSAIEVERERQMIEQEVAKVEAETKLQVDSIEQEIKNVTTRTTAEIEKLKGDYAARIALLDSQRTKVSGETEAMVKKLKETAKSQLHQKKMEVFRNDANAYLRCTLAEQLNPNLVLRLFHSGPGTLWTNMDSKGMNFMMPVPAGEKEPKKPVRADKKETPPAVVGD